MVRNNTCKCMPTLCKKCIWTARPTARPLAGNPLRDVVRSRIPSKSTLAHDAVATAVLHKHHPIIRVGAGLIQFVYRSHLRLATEVTRNRNAFFVIFRASFSIYVHLMETTSICLCSWLSVALVFMTLNYICFHDSQLHLPVLSWLSVVFVFMTLMVYEFSRLYQYVVETIRCKWVYLIAAVRCSVCCSVLQCVAVCCGVLYCVAACLTLDQGTRME